MIPQTKVKLFNQLLAQKYSEDDLRTILKTFEFAAALFAGRFQTCGKPFLAHGIGTAGILASLGAPAELVAAGLIHNASSYGEFGIGAVGVSRAKSRYFRKVVGPRIERYVTSFPAFSITPSTAQKLLDSISGLDGFERNLLLISLAEHLEKLENLEPLFNGNNGNTLQAIFDQSNLLVQMCERLGYPALGANYRDAINRLGSAQIPSIFRQHNRLISFFLPVKTLFRRSQRPILRVKPN